MQPTTQRLAVATVVLAEDSHPTAEMVFGATREILPSVSQATVYNTLNRFVEAGLLVPVDVPGRATRFDPRVDHHHHLYDVDSGELMDLDPDDLSVTLSDEALQAYDVERVRIRVDVRRRD